MVRIVFFMATGMILMALMILQPPKAVALASKITSSLTIGGLIVGLGCLEFIRRLREHGKKTTRIIENNAAELSFLTA